VIALDLAGTFKRGQGTVKRLVSKTQFCSQILQGAAEFKYAAISLGIKDEKMPHAFPCRADVALLDTGAKV
jgi:hypothetical protein